MGGEEVLPGEFAGGVGVFFGQGVGEVDFAIAGGEVFFVEEADAFDLALQVGDNGFGQRDDAVFFAFAVADGDALVLKVNILDSQADAFHEAQAGAVEELGHEFVGSVQLADEVENFFAAEDGGEALGTFGGGEDDRFDFFVEDFAVEEEEGAEGLVLGGGRDVTVVGEVEEKGLDFRCPHFGGVTFVVEEDETAHPVYIRGFGAIGIVFESQGFAELVEEFFGHRADSLLEGGIIYCVKMSKSGACGLGGLVHDYSIFSWAS